ncbi:MAG: hypothetical protein AB8I08_34865 [Sandaracinaceae bacterium]
MRLTKAEWTSHVSAWRSSGSSARAYCEERELKVSSLRYWSGRIRRESREALDDAFDDSPPRFAKVRTPERSAAGARAAAPIRVVVSEVAVEVPVDFDAETLRRVLDVLGGGGR